MLSTFRPFIYTRVSPSQDAWCDVLIFFQEGNPECAKGLLHQLSRRRPQQARLVFRRILLHETTPAAISLTDPPVSTSAERYPVLPASFGHPSQALFPQFSIGIPVAATSQQTWSEPQFLLSRTSNLFSRTTRSDEGNQSLASYTETPSFWYTLSAAGERFPDLAPHFPGNGPSFP